MKDPLSRKYAFCLSNKHTSNIRNAIIGVSFNKMVNYVYIYVCDCIIEKRVV